MVTGCVEVGGGVGVGVGVEVGRIGFPFVEDGAQLGFGAEEPDPLAAVAHAGFEDPPFDVGGVVVIGRASGVSGEAVVQFVELEQGFVEELGVVELEIQGRLHVVAEKGGGVFCAPGQDGVGEIVFADEGFAEKVGVGEGCGGMTEEVGEVDGFVRGDLEEGRCG